MKAIASRIASYHRILLVLSSVVIGVVGSRVATDPTELGSWALLAASGVTLLIADVGRHVDESGRALAAATRTPIELARRDATGSADVRLILIGGAGGALLILGAIFWILFVD